MTATHPAQELAIELWRLFDASRFRDALPLLAEDFEAHWPNTRERIRGPENFIALNESYPGVWRCTVRRIEECAGGVVTGDRNRRRPDRALRGVVLPGAGWSNRRGRGVFRRQRPAAVRPLRLDRTLLSGRRPTGGEEVVKIGAAGGLHAVEPQRSAGLQPAAGYPGVPVVPVATEVDADDGGHESRNRRHPIRA